MDFNPQTTCWPSSSGSIGKILRWPTGEPTTVGLANIFGKLAIVGKLAGFGSFALFGKDALCGKLASHGKLASFRGDDGYSKVELIGNVVSCCKIVFSLDDSLSLATPLSLANLSPCCRCHLWQSSLPWKTSCELPFPVKFALCGEVTFLCEVAVLRQFP